MLGSHVRESGDTIIEVIFAVMIFSLIAVGGMSIMNQGIATTQRSLEINLVRQQIDAQAEALRYLNQLYVADSSESTAANSAWLSVHSSGGASAPNFDSLVEPTGKTCSAIPSSAFALDTTKLDTATPKVAFLQNSPGTYARIVSTASGTFSEGISVFAVRSPVLPGQPTGYVDFHIRACWQSPGQERPVTLGTIVRLYEPRY